MIFEWGPRDVHEEDGVVAALSEKFGINLTVERILAREYNQSLETRIAAGDVPDLFRLRNNNIYATLRDDGVLVNWSELADELSLPHVKQWLQSEGIEGYSEGGAFYRLPSRKGPSKTSIMIRSDWLQETRTGHATGLRAVPRRTAGVRGRAAGRRRHHRHHRLHGLGPLGAHPGRLHRHEQLGQDEWPLGVRKDHRAVPRGPCATWRACTPTA